MNDLPPGIHDYEVDNQFGGEDETYCKLPDHEIERRKKLVKELGLSLKNPFTRMYVNGR